MIKYLGSKRRLIPSILGAVRLLPDVRTVVDLFSGTSRVGHALKSSGYRVLANDHNTYAAVWARCYVQADREDVLATAQRLVQEFNRLPGRPGYFTETFCERSRFFQPKNGARIDAIREEIERKDLEPELKAVMLTALMEAADDVDSTTGVQMAYLKKWAGRAALDLELRIPDVLPRARSGKGRASELDALAAAEQLEGDVAYLDPPYNQHSYLGNYHIWETLARWDKPEVYGCACKRVDRKVRSSAFNSKHRHEDALRRVVEKIRARWIVLSFNDEGYLTRPTIEKLLQARGVVTVLSRDFKRYVGAQIGIYNATGEKVGRVGHPRNTEHIFVVGPHRVDLTVLAGESPDARQGVLF